MSFEQVAGCSPNLFAQLRRIEDLDVPREAEKPAAKLARARNGRFDEEPVLALAGDALVVREARVEEEAAGLAADAEAQSNRLGRQRHVQLAAAEKLVQVEPGGTSRACSSSSALRMRASAS